MFVAATDAAPQAAQGGTVRYRLKDKLPQAYDRLTNSSMKAYGGDATSTAQWWCAGDYVVSFCRR